jgi:hypothetical protein
MTDLSTPGPGRETATPHHVLVPADDHGSTAMYDNTTPAPEDELLRLNAAQLKALAVLREGGSVNAAATASNRDRATVWRWKTHHPEFRAALSRSVREIDEQDRALAQRIRHAGLTALQKMVEDGDFRAINVVARTSRIFDVRLDANTGPVDADGFIEELVDREIERARQEGIDRAAAGIPDLTVGPASVETRADVRARVERNLRSILLDEPATRTACRSYDGDAPAPDPATRDDPATTGDIVTGADADGSAQQPEPGQLDFDQA